MKSALAGVVKNIKNVAFKIGTSVPAIVTSPPLSARTKVRVWGCFGTGTSVPAVAMFLQV